MNPVRTRDFHLIDGDTPSRDDCLILSFASFSRTFDIRVLEEQIIHSSSETSSDDNLAYARERRVTSRAEVEELDISPLMTSLFHD